jgi:MFS family permease
MVINRNYTWLWAGKTVSLAGDFVFDTTVLLWVATVLVRGERHAPIVSGAVLAVASLTMVLVGPVAGVLVDRWPDKRAVMLRADLIRAGLIGVLSIVAGLPAGAVPRLVLLGLIGAVVAASTAVAQFFNAARFVVIGDVVPEHQRGRAMGYAQASAAVAAAVGPPLAGPLLFGLGPQWAMVTNAASFLVSYLAIRAVRIASTPDRSAARSGIGRDYLAGLRVISGSRVLTGVVVSRTVAVLGAGAVSALDVYFVAENLHADPRTWFGVLGATVAAGAFAGGLLGGPLADRLGAARVYTVAILVNGCLILAYSRMHAIGPALAVVFAETVTVGVMASATMPLFLARVPRQYQGRVSSVLTLSYQLPSLMSALLAGVAVAMMRRIDVVFAAAGVLILVAGVYALWTLHPAARAEHGSAKPGETTSPQRVRNRIMAARTPENQPGAGKDV